MKYEGMKDVDALIELHYELRHRYLGMKDKITGTRDRITLDHGFPEHLPNFFKEIGRELGNKTPYIDAGLDELAKLEKLILKYEPSVSEDTYDPMEQHRLLTRLFKRYLKNELASGEYVHLRGPNQREKVEDDFLDSLFKISLMARPPYIGGNGVGHLPSDSPSQTQVHLYVHGTMVDETDYTKGFQLDSNSYRAVVGNSISLEYPFYLYVLKELGKANSLPVLLEEGNYEEFVRNLLVIADGNIDAFIQDVR